MLLFVLPCIICVSKKINQTLKLFFKEKCNTWHGQVWKVFKHGSRCGFGTWCITTPFPRHKMKGFLVAEAGYLDKILNKENNNENTKN